MTTPARAEEEKEPLPKTVIELAGWSIREFGFAAILAMFVFVQWQADQQRTERIEAILVSNSEVLRTTSMFMERLGKQLEIHEATAKAFISDTSRDLNAIKLNTSSK